MTMSQLNLHVSWFLPRLKSLCETTALYTVQKLFVPKGWGNVFYDDDPRPEVPNLYEFPMH